MEEREIDALVVGAGPAGLMAADALASAGRHVLVVEAMPSPARKFLMAGKSGLNLTRSETAEAFLTAYGEAAQSLQPMIAAFGPDHVQDWARGLGQDVFTGTTGRVFPTAMKASPLLRSWLARLDGLGVTLERRWRWTGWDKETTRFDTPSGPVAIVAGVTVLALGGASWPRLGSDGGWVAPLRDAGVEVTSLQPANAAIGVAWSEHMAPHFGTPLKGIALRAGDRLSRGESVISPRGLEGGGVYPLTPAIRNGATLTLDLKPDMDAPALAARLAAMPARLKTRDRLRRLGLTPVAIALLQECARPLPQGAALADPVKALKVPHGGTGPLDHAISTAGGVAWSAVDATLMLQARPGVFVAGEMLDWEAPTGGYLLTGCLATGLWAGRAGADFTHDGTKVL